MIFGITGSTGFLGRTLQQAAKEIGDTTIHFTRHPQPASASRLFTTSTIPDFHQCEGIVHLAGESILGIWTQEKRRKILESRREGTRRVVEGIAQASTKPSVLISASAIGFYGNRDDEILDESSSPGNGFLSEVTQVWEEEALRAEELGVRVVLMRFGLLLGKHGGMVPLLKPLFLCGLGSTLGSGHQWMSCIEVHDAARLILHCLHHSAFRGPVNAVMPHPISNNTFTKTLAKTIHRRALLSLPASVLCFILGDLSHLLLDSQRVLPLKAREHNYHFRYPTVAMALK